MAQIIKYNMCNTEQYKAKSYNIPVHRYVFHKNTYYKAKNRIQQLFEITIPIRESEGFEDKSFHL